MKKWQICYATQRTKNRQPSNISKSILPCLLMATVSNLVSAETAKEQGAILEEVFVTAQFRKQSVQETPIAITAVTGDMLEARIQTNIFEVSRQAPNVTLTPQGQAWGPAMVAFIRGVGQSDFIYALEPGVGIYVDDVYYSTLTGSLLELMDLDRVEILRGPQGTLAGRNSVGGAVKLFSKKPTGEGVGDISVTYGSYDRLDFSGNYDFTVVPDKLFARISGMSQSKDGYIKRVDYGCSHPSSGVPTFAVGDGCNLGTLGGKSLTAARLALLWNASDSVQVDFSADITNDHSEAGGDVLRYANATQSIDDGDPSTPVVFLDNRFVAYGPNAGDPNGSNPYITYSTFMDPNQPTASLPYSPHSLAPIQYFEGKGFSTAINWEISENFELNSITAYREYETKFTEDADGSPIHGQLAYQQLEHEQYSQELRLNGTVADGEVDFTAGLFWFQSDGVFRGRFSLPYLPADFIHPGDPSSNDSQAVFLNSTWHATDRMNISAGIRYSKDEKSYRFFRRNPDGTIPSIPCGAPPQAPNCSQFGLDNQPSGFDGDNTDWRIALDYSVNEDILVYGSVSTGYRAGGINPRPFFGPGSILPVNGNSIDFINGIPIDVNQIGPFEPETLTAYEIGAKMDLLDKTLRLNMSAFRNDYEDIILNLQFCPIFCFKPTNVGTAEVSGFEVELQYYPTSKLSIDASFSKLDFQYTETDFSRTFVSKDMTSPFTPDTQASLGIQFDFYTGPAGTLTGRIDTSYQSKMFAEAINATNNKIDGYTLTNLHFMWISPDESWSTSLEGINIADTYYELSRFDQSNGPAQTVTANPGTPRTWAIKIKHQF